MTSRYAEEQQLIERWLQAVEQAAACDLALAHEIALCARLIKGYSDTQQRGKANFSRIMRTLVEPGGRADLAAAVKEAREAALADPDGAVLEAKLSARGIVPREPRAQPLKFFPRPTEGRKVA
jgi:indolepyruvate ferredoxin oxidoreductase beta subunit